MGCGCGKKKADVAEADVAEADVVQSTVVQSDVVQSTLDTKATASLNEEVNKELDIPDPEAEKARATLQGGFGA